MPDECEAMVRHAAVPPFVLGPSQKLKTPANLRLIWAPSTVPLPATALAGEIALMIVGGFIDANGKEHGFIAR